MSAKAIYFFIVLLLFALFASFNLQNTVAVSLGFKTFENIPVFLFALFSFLIGFLFTIPFFIKSSAKDNRTSGKEKAERLSAEMPAAPAESTSSMNGIQEVELKGEKKSWFQKLKENKKKDDNKTK